jgi:hypothetical protein
MLLKHSILFLSRGPLPIRVPTCRHELLTPTPFIARRGCAWSVKVWRRTCAGQTLQRIDPVYLPI